MMNIFVPGFPPSVFLCVKYLLPKGRHHPKNRAEKRLRDVTILQIYETARTRSHVSLDKLLSSSRPNRSIPLVNAVPRISFWICKLCRPSHPQCGRLYRVLEFHQRVPKIRFPFATSLYKFVLVCTSSRLLYCKHTHTYTELKKTILVVRRMGDSDIVGYACDDPIEDGDDSFYANAPPEATTSSLIETKPLCVFCIGNTAVTRACASCCALLACAECSKLEQIRSIKKCPLCRADLIPAH